MKAMFGFGYNKEKSRAAAEKYLQQNKLQNAVAEYEKILQNEPNDMAVVNTVGDVYSRLGQNDKAIERFKVVAESYSSEGQFLKSIAMFRKIVKLDGNDLASMEKLAELYRRQGLVSDARSMLLQAADAHTRKNQPKETLRLLKQLVAFDPENVQVIARTADLLSQGGSKAEAMQMLSQSATTLIMRESFAPAQKILERLLALDPGNTRAQELRAQATLQLGDAKKAAELYEQIADIDSRPDALRNLLVAYINMDNLEEALPVARKLATVHHDGHGIANLAARRFSDGDALGALALYDEFADLVFSQDKEDVVSHLHSIVGRVRGNPDALQTVYNLFQRSGEISTIGEVLELLAHASVQANQLERAKKAYKELIELEPGNATHIQGYRQVCARLDAAGGGAAPAPAAAKARHDEPSSLDEFLAADEPKLPRQLYRPEVEERIQAALSESDLCESYASKGRSISALETALAEAPEDLRLLRSLARLYRQENEPAKASDCFAVMQRVLDALGDNDAAAYYGNLMAADQTTTWEASGTEFSTSDFTAPEVEEIATPAEIDLSDDWDDWEAPTASKPAKTPPAPKTPPPAKAVPARAAAPSRAAETTASPEQLAEILEEIRFCLAQQFWSEAEAGITRLAGLSPNQPDLSNLRNQLVRGRAGLEMPAPEPQPPGEGIEVIEVEDLPSPQAAAPSRAPAFAPPPEAPTLNSLAEELEFELGEAFEPVAKPITPPRAPAPPPPPPPAPVAPPPQLQKPPAKPARPAMPAQRGASVFGDLLQEFESGLAAPQEEDGDAETHYNLGIAFREMGLLDEAIGELQKAARMAEHGLDNDKLQHAYIWLATCFAEKNVYEASIKWYLRALEAATDEESRTAVNYELASAYEAAGHKQEALDRFMEVYGSNIDYRDVAGRIRELRESH